MSHYMCRLLNDARHEQNVVPIIASSVEDAIAIACSLLRHQEPGGGFELWEGGRCLVAHGSGAMKAAADSKAGPPAGRVWHSSLS